jgi:phosphonate degradation associated HDIG domain protein
MPLDILDLRSLFESYGATPYSSEPVTQLEHALQTATLAENEGAPSTLVAAAFLHDLGHMLRLHQKTTDTPKPNEDDLHQFFALPFLRSMLPDAVLEPIKLHVDAKRCLCAIDPGYYATLSPVSVHSLQLQGGVYTAEQVSQFRSQPYADDAMRLRRWDDRAKVSGAATFGLEHFLAVVESVQQERA